MKKGYIILLLVICSLLTNMVLFNNRKLIESDGCVYSQMGKNLVQGKGFTYNGFPDFTWPPLTSLSLAAGYALFGVSEPVGNGVIILFSALCIIPLFLIAERHFGRRIAILACILFIANNTIILYSNVILSDIPALFFFLMFLYCFDKENYLLSALFLGLMVLTRRTAYIFLILASIYLLYKHFFIKSDWKVLILFPLIFILVYSPYAIYVNSITGSPFYNGSWGHVKMGGQTSTLITSVFANTVEREVLFYSAPFEGKTLNPIDFIKDNIFTLLKKWGTQFCGMFLSVIPLLVNPLLFIPFLCGLFIGKGKFRNMAFLFAIPMIMALIILYTSQRHAMVIMPFLIIFSAVGLDRMLSSFKYKHIILAFIILIILSPSVLNKFFYEPNFPEYKSTAVWIKDNLPSDSTFLSRKPQIPYYAGGMTWSHFPITLNSTLEYANKYGYDYIIFDEGYTAVFRPEERDLLTKDNVDGFELVYYDPTPLHQVKIWGIKKDG